MVMKTEIWFFQEGSRKEEEPTGERCDISFFRSPNLNKITDAGVWMVFWYKCKKEVELSVSRKQQANKGRRQP